MSNIFIPIGYDEIGGAFSSLEKVDAEAPTLDNVHEFEIDNPQRVRCWGRRWDESTHNFQWYVWEENGQRVP